MFPDSISIYGRLVGQCFVRDFSLLVVARAYIYFSFRFCAEMFFLSVLFIVWRNWFRREPSRLVLSNFTWPPFNSKYVFGGVPRVEIYDGLAVGNLVWHAVVNHLKVFRRVLNQSQRLFLRRSGHMCSMGAHNHRFNMDAVLSFGHFHFVIKSQGGCLFDTSTNLQWWWHQHQRGRIILQLWHTSYRFGIPLPYIGRSITIDARYLLRKASWTH